MIGINLIDPSVLSARRRKRRIQRWVLAALTGGGVGAFPVGLEISRHQQVMALEGEKSVLQSRIDATRDQLNAIGIEIRNLEAQTARASALRTKRSWSGLLALLSSIAPEEVWFVSLATDPATPGRGSKDLTPPKPPPTAAAATKTPADKPAKPEPPAVVMMEAPRALVFEGYALEHRNLYDFMSRLKESNLFADVSLTKAAEEPVLSGKAVRFKIQCRW